MYSEDDCLPLSGIQHYAFCRRQFALIHVERQWQENIMTFEGRTMHERTDNPFFMESRGTVLIARAVPLISTRLGLYGVADVVEFRRTLDNGVRLSKYDGVWSPYPVEYKRGQAKPDDRDIVQVAAQAMCLEEMLGVRCNEAAIYYGRTRRRQVVTLDDMLRKRVEDLALGMHETYCAGVTPGPREDKKVCRNCSLEDLCLPKVAAKKSVARYVASMRRE